MSVIIANCPLCINMDMSVKYPAPCKCKAFPDGIPEDYLWEQNGIILEELDQCNNGFGFKKKPNR